MIFLTLSIGSVCSGIEAASVAWNDFDVKFSWFSEIADFPSKLLKVKYPNIINVGDMNDIPEKLNFMTMKSVDIICAGTPCQAFSLAGWQNGLNDDRGNLTLKFVEIVEANDNIRLKEGKNRCKVFWENVEGVLKDKTNAFGCLVSSLAGFKNVLTIAGNKWPNAGIIEGPIRNVAWRVLDAKYFGLPQQRRRLYLIASDKDFHPENVLFEVHTNPFATYPNYPLKFEKDGHSFEIFRSYTDCLYSAYGTKWNGNAAAYNGSLFVVQDGRIRRLSPLETERLMGFPDNYTNLLKSKNTNRYQGVGNSWAVPVVKWLGSRLFSNVDTIIQSAKEAFLSNNNSLFQSDIKHFINLDKTSLFTEDNKTINCSPIPENCSFSSLESIITPDAPEQIYISPTACFGIVRRKTERNLKMNARLEEILLHIASQKTIEEIDKASRIQKRGKFSMDTSKVASIVGMTNTTSVSAIVK